MQYLTDQSNTCGFYFPYLCLSNPNKEQKWQVQYVIIRVLAYQKCTLQMLEIGKISRIIILHVLNWLPTISLILKQRETEKLEKSHITQFCSPFYFLWFFFINELSDIYWEQQATIEKISKIFQENVKQQLQQKYCILSFPLKYIHNHEKWTTP